MPGDGLFAIIFRKSSLIPRFTDRKRCNKSIAINEKRKDFLFPFLVFLFLSACAPGRLVTDETPSQNANSSMQASLQVSTPSSTQTAMAGSIKSGETSPAKNMTQIYTASSPEIYQIGPGDAGMIEDKVYLDSVQVQITPGMPDPVLAVLAGSLPTACHRLRVVPVSSVSQDQVALKAYSLIQNDQVCIQQIQAFTVAIPLQQKGGVKTYHLVVNGREFLTFEWPE